MIATSEQRLLALSTAALRTTGDDRRNPPYADQNPKQVLASMVFMAHDVDAMTTHAHHLLKAAAMHNDLRHQRDLLLEALEKMVATHPAFHRPLGAPHSPVRINQDEQNAAIMLAQRAIALARKGEITNEGTS